MNKLIALVALAAACGGKQAAPAHPSETALGIADLKFYEGDHVVAHLGADGSFEIDQGGQLVRVGTITADGKLTGKDGKGAQLQPDGTLVALGGASKDDAAIKLVGDTLTISGENGQAHQATIDAQGAVLVDGKPLTGKTLHIAGATDASTRRTALLVFGLMDTPGSAHTSAPVSVSAPVDPLTAHTGAFFVKFADAMDASGGDCEKLAAGLQALSPDAKTLRAEFVAAHKKLDDMKDPPPGLEERFKVLKQPHVFDNCGKNAHVKAGVDATIMVIAPIEENSEFINAFADAFGKAMAPK